MAARNPQSDVPAAPRPVLRPGLHESVPEIHADAVQTGTPSYTGKGVIVGIVDSGIDLFHNCFRTPDNQRQSRIVAIWDQTLGPPGAAPPAAGLLITDQDIENALVKDPDGKLEPGDLTPADSPAFKHKDETGHGTHIAGIAAGNGAQAGNCHAANYYRGVAPDARLIVVKYDGQRGDVAANVINAVKFIFAKAQNTPAVVNISLNLEDGRVADGTNDLDTGLDALLLDGAGNPIPGRAIVVIPGNLGTADWHAFEQIPPLGTFTRRVRVGPRRMLPAFLDLWYSGSARLRFTVTGPNGEVSAPVDPPPSATSPATGFTNPLAGTTVTTRSRRGKNDHNHEIECTLFPSAKGAIPHGLWSITAVETAGVGTEVDAHIIPQYNDTPIRFFYGPDFDTPEPNNPVDAHTRMVDRTRTVESPGSAHNVITVGAYKSDDGAFWEPSSRGPTADGRPKPDVCAPGYRIVAPQTDDRTHWYCCDWWCSFYVGGDGTSEAAPHVTGVVAMMLQRNPRLTFEQIRQILRTSARDPGTAALPDGSWGWGKLDARQAVTSTPLPPPLPGGGGGGGGGDQFTDDPIVLPFGSELDRLPRPRTVRDLLERFRDSATGQLVAALASTHYDEVYRLIQTNRKIATLWHRLDVAPLLKPLLSSCAANPASALDDRRAKYFGALLAALSRHGSASLREDVMAHGHLFRRLLQDGPRAFV